MGLYVVNLHRDLKGVPYSVMYGYITLDIYIYIDGYTLDVDIYAGHIQYIYIYTLATLVPSKSSSKRDTINLHVPHSKNKGQSTQGNHF